MSQPSRTVAPRRHLTLTDCTSIIVGIIIGAGIYETTPHIAQNVSGPGMLIGVYLLGGVASLIGALCYAELTTMYPREGGDYVFITQAYGRRMGFLLAWSWFWVVRPGSIGAMAFIFARYATELRPLGLGAYDLLVYAVASVAAFTMLNIVGLRSGAWTQNVLTAAKTLGLLMIFAVGIVAEPPARVAPAETATANFTLAMIFVLFTYGGWNDISYVAAEVREPRRNLLRSLIIGTLAVTVLYVAASAAFVQSLGFEGVAGSQAMAAEVMTGHWDRAGANFISVLICISALGAINGMLLTGGRVYSALGADHRLFAWLGHWHPRLGTPARSLIVQGVVTVALIGSFGAYEEGFGRMVTFTAPVFWFFLTLVAMSIFVLRRRQPEVERPYRVPLYPVTPLLFTIMCAFMLYASVEYAAGQRHSEAAWTVVTLLVGLVLARFVRGSH